MKESLPVFVGIDVSKAELVVATAGQPASQCIANDNASIAQWLNTLPANAALAMESTGRYHQQVLTLALAAGLRAYVLNARDVYFYAKGLGSRAKTDALDAQVIARYLAEHHASLHPWQAPPAVIEQVQRLLGQRSVVATKRAALRECLQGEHTAPAALAEPLQALEDAFADLLRGMERRITQLLETAPELSQRRALLQSIVGVGPQTSALLVGLLARLPFASADALVAYSGLDPRASDSGKSRGRRRLSKRGPPLIRRQMFLAAMSASHTKTFKGMYQKLRDRGLASTEALVVLARKLLRIAFAVWKTQMPFDASRFLANTA